MPYPFLNAGTSISKSPKEDYTILFQQTLYEQFYNSSNWYTIEEETPFASGNYENLDVRINPVTISMDAGQRKILDDTKTLLFQDISHPTELGKFYRFNDNYWITTNIDKTKTLATTAVVKRCNNVLRWQDLEGAVYESPCSLDFLLKLNRDYSTAGSSIVIPAGKLECLTQFNSKTNKILPNQRFLFGNKDNWIAYRIEGGGLGNFDNASTENNMSVGILRLTLEADYLNTETDDVVNGIANYVKNSYVLTLDQSIISGNYGQTIQLHSVITLNGNTVTRSFVWSSDDENVATVDSTGLVTFLNEGTTTISCKLLNNDNVMATCSAQSISVPVDTYTIVFDPDSNFVLEGKEKTWNVRLYKNENEQGDAFSFSIDANTVPSVNYVYTVLGTNSFKIRNYKMFLTDTLDITVTSGIYSKLLSVSLRGPW